MSTINERFREVREYLKLTQTEFATMANRTRSEISNIEYNKTSPKEEVIKAVCSAHGISRQYLETGEEPMLMLPLDEESELIDRFMENSDNPLRSTIVAIIKTYMQLEPKDQEILKDFVKSLSGNLK